jgi:hypothetical protein
MTTRERITAEVAHRGSLTRYAEVARQYRHAFRAVQEELQSLQPGQAGPWVFALEDLSREELCTLSPTLAQAEHERRAWRVALHAITELIALQDALPVPIETDGPAAFDTLDGEAQSQHQLDQFISVLHGARAGGCIYVDGTFHPAGYRTGSTGSPAHQHSDVRRSTKPLYAPEIDPT